jgi:hypothetical protein
MTSSSQKKWHSLGDFLRAKEEREKEEARQQLESPTPVVTPATTPVDTGVTTPAPPSIAEPEAGRDKVERRVPAFLDATHTSSESRIYSIMYRETISKGVRERHFGPKELCDKTGIRSDRTIRTAIDGLILKLSIEIVSNTNGNPLGPRYRVFDPKEIERRRRAVGMEIDTQSKKIVTPVTTPVTTGDKTYRGTGAESTPVTPVEIAGVYINRENTLLAEGKSDDDDAALAGLHATLKQAAEEVTGKELSASERERWRELGEVLATELKIAAARTTVSSAPSFLAEHLRRRLWKKEKRELQAEASTGAQPTSNLSAEQSKACPDCGGTGFRYKGENFTGGVEKCRHDSLVQEPPAT